MQEVQQGPPTMDEQMQDDVDLITGTVFISCNPAYILIDTGASHSLVSVEFISTHGWSSVRQSLQLQ